MGDFKNNSIYIWQSSNAVPTEIGEKLVLVPPLIRNTKKKNGGKTTIAN